MSAGVQCSGKGMPSRPQGSHSVSGGPPLQVAKGNCFTPTSWVQFLQRLPGFPRPPAGWEGPVSEFTPTPSGAMEMSRRLFPVRCCFTNDAQVSPSPLALLYDPKEIDAATPIPQDWGGGEASQPLPLKLPCS